MSKPVVVVRRVPPPPEINWSEEQKVIFADFRDKNSGNVVIDAYAGTGKSTTTFRGSKMAPEVMKVVTCYNKEIQLHAAKMLEDEKQAKTAHGIGYAAVTMSKPGIEIVVDKNVSYDRAEDAVDYWKERTTDPEIYDWLVEEGVVLAVKVGSRVKNTQPWARTVEEIRRVIVQMCGDWSIQMPDHVEEDEEDRFSTILGKIVLDCQDASLESYYEPQEVEGEHGPKWVTTIDFDDMIWLPVRLKLARKRWDLIMIDEAQDMNFTQTELAIMSCRGRIFVIGDPNQAIYGFRGADSFSMDRLCKRLKAKRRKLSITHRCPKKHVELAKEYVPDFRCADDAPEGVLEYCGEERMMELAAEGDAIISRLNAPLMSLALRLIASGRRAMIAGKEVGEALVKLLEKVEGKKPYLNDTDMWQRLKAWQKKECDKIVAGCQKRGGSPKAIQMEIDEQCQPVLDKMEIFKAMLKYLRSPAKVKSELKRMFCDEKEKLKRDNYIILTSIHKAKGLEWNRTFVLTDTLKNTKQEEKNLCYVALTRSKNEMYLVGEGAPTDIKLEQAGELEMVEAEEPQPVEVVEPVEVAEGIPLGGPAEPKRFGSLDPLTARALKDIEREIGIRMMDKISQYAPEDEVAEVVGDGNFMGGLKPEFKPQGDWMTEMLFEGLVGGKEAPPDDYEQWEEE